MESERGKESCLQEGLQSPEHKQESGLFGNLPDLETQKGQYPSVLRMDTDLKLWGNRAAASESVGRWRYDLHNIISDRVEHELAYRMHVQLAHEI
jgi:hypothetical protein